MSELFSQSRFIVILTPSNAEIREIAQTAQNYARSKTNGCQVEVSVNSHDEEYPSRHMLRFDVSCQDKEQLDSCDLMIASTLCRECEKRGLSHWL